MLLQPSYFQCVQDFFIQFVDLIDHLLEQPGIRDRREHRRHVPVCANRYFTDFSRWCRNRCEIELEGRSWRIVYRNRKYKFK